MSGRIDFAGAGAASRRGDARRRRDLSARSSLDAAAKAAQARRTRSLQEAAAFLTLVQHLKDRAPFKAVGAALSDPVGLAPSQNADRGAAAAGCPFVQRAGIRPIGLRGWRTTWIWAGRHDHKQDDAMRRVRKAVIPVAGLGTRFLPATKAMPKEMLTIVDRPVVQYAVDEALEAGIEHIVFVTGRNKRVIEDYFDMPVRAGSTRWPRRARRRSWMSSCASCLPPAGTISFTRQQAPHGLGHAVWCARDIIGNEPFALLLPDMVSFGDKGCLAGVMELYEQTGGNVLAVEQCDPLETTATASSEGRQRRQRFRHHRDGREAGARGSALQPSSSTDATSCSPRFSRSSTPRSAAPATRSS